MPAGCSELLKERDGGARRRGRAQRRRPGLDHRACADGSGRHPAGAAGPRRRRRRGTAWPLLGALSWRLTKSSRRQTGEIAAPQSGHQPESLRAQAVPADRQSRPSASRRPSQIPPRIKFASPSASVHSRRDRSPGGRGYAAADRGGAHRPAFFGGSLERLAQVRERLEQPLAKDFILEPYQVVEARVYGADAILLILAAIDDQTWQACADQAGRLGMDVLTECMTRPSPARWRWAPGSSGSTIVISVLAVDPGHGAPHRIPPDRPGGGRIGDRFAGDGRAAPVPRRRIPGG